MNKGYKVDRAETNAEQVFVEEKWHERTYLGAKYNAQMQVYLYSQRTRAITLNLSTRPRLAANIESTQ